jgi:hypothetical protein
MKRPLRSVPWFKPAPDFHRPSRRITPRRSPGEWTWTAESMGERWAALCHRSRGWRAVNDVGIALLLAAGLIGAICLLFAEGGR